MADVGAAFAQALAVIRRDHDRGLVEDAGGAQPVLERGQAAIGVLDLAVVQRPHLIPLRGLHAHLLDAAEMGAGDLLAERPCPRPGKYLSVMPSWKR